MGNRPRRKMPYQESGQRSRDEYRLTDKGLDLYPVLVALQLQLSCRAGHVLESARQITPGPGPGARKIA